jgi:hypothetical protein
MRQFGPGALFAQGAIVHLAIAAFALWRLASDLGAGRPAPRRDAIP